MTERRSMIGRKRQFFSKNGYPKILIAAPIYEHKYYCIQDYINNLRELSYPNSDFLLVDNSANETAHETVKEFNQDIEIHYIPFSGTTRSSQCDAYNFIRDTFLRGDYEYLMVIESDVFPHETIVEDLMANDVDICGALYMIFTQDGKTKGIPCVTTGKMAYDGVNFRETFMDYKEIDGELKEIMGGCGLGCTLIKRSVLEKIRFRYDTCHADTYFHRDAHRNGFKTFVDTRFMCAHYPSFYPEYF